MYLPVDFALDAACCLDVSRPVLCCVHVDPARGALAATNSYILAVAPYTPEDSEMVERLVPAAAFADARKAAKASKNTRLHIALTEAGAVVQHAHHATTWQYAVGTCSD